MFRRVGLPVLLSIGFICVLSAQSSKVEAVISSPGRPSPTCSTVTLEDPKNNAKSLAESLNGVAEGIIVRAVGTKTLVICGDNSNQAVQKLEEAATKLGQEQTSKPSPREAPAVRLFFNRDAPAIVTLLTKVFPKLGAYAVGTDTVVLGNPDGSDAATVAGAKRWISALDLPRAEVDMNIWSVQVSGKDLDSVGKLATTVRKIVAQHNRELEMALQRVHMKLVELQSPPKDKPDMTSEQTLKDFLAPRFGEYLSRRYIVSDDPAEPNLLSHNEACRQGEYCLGYTNIFVPFPTLSSLLINAIAARSPELVSMKLVNALENAPERSTQPVRTAGYSQSAGAKELSDIYGVRSSVDEQHRKSPDLHGCEQLAAAVYDDKHKRHETADAGGSEAPQFPCLREALSDAVQGASLAHLRVAIADFLMQYKFMQHYPDAVDPVNDAVHHMDSLAAPLLSAFHRDMAAYVRHVREEIEMQKLKGVDSSNNGIVSLATISTIPSSVSTVSQSAFPLPPTFALKDFLAASAPNTTSPAFLAKNLGAGVAAPLVAGLSLDTTPSVATIGRGLTMAVIPQSLPGGSVAELNINLTSQDEAPPAVQRGSTSKPDLKSRVAKHNLQTVVRVKSLRLFEVSGFASVMTRGSDGIPIIPPYMDLPVIGSLLRWPTKPGQVHHRSFAIASAVVMPTAADLASTVTPIADMTASEVAVKVKAAGLDAAAAAATSFVQYVVVAHRQSSDDVAGATERLENKATPVQLSWTALGDDVAYDVYRVKDEKSWELLASGQTKSNFTDKPGPALKQDKPTLTCFVLPGASTPPASCSQGSKLVSLSRISPQSFLTQRFRSFHKAMLHCIAEEAAARIAPGCDKLSMARLTNEGR